VVFGFGPIKEVWIISLSAKFRILFFGLILTAAFVPSPVVAKRSFDERFAEAERFRFANDFPTALNRYESLVKMRPADSRIRANYGMLLVQTGNPTGGKQEIDRALLLNSDDPEAHQALAVFYMVRGDKESARREYSKSISLDPQRDCHCGVLQAYLGIAHSDAQNVLKKGTSGATKGGSKNSSKSASKNVKATKPF
jgi:tetratricopeptide (TPR) repeat protein